VIADAPLPGPTNMARDHALARGLSAGAGVLRFYGWVPATVSFGKNEPARGLYLQEEAEREGVAFVRRPTGGRAVLHHQELTYAVVFPLGVFGGLRDSYHLINRGLMTGLRLLGAAAELALGTGPGLPPNAGPCFRQPAEGEVTAVGRKLVGSAQVRLGPCVLQHGSLILDGDQDLLRRIRVGHAVVPPPATLRSLLGAVPETGRLTSALQQGLALTLGGSWHESAFRKEEEAAARELEEHYRDPEWTWRL
jgi:lipoate-protein ligase A